MKKDYDIGKAFEEIEEELIASMIRNMNRHRAEETVQGIEWTQWQAEQLKALERYKLESSKKYRKKFKSIHGKLSDVIQTARATGNMEQEIDILEAIRNGFQGTQNIGRGLSGEFFRLNDRKLNALMKATTRDMQKAETAILRMANDQYRKVIFNAQVYANTGAGTYERAVDMATRDFLSRGLNCVEYANGARHTLADYADMALRTASKRAYLTGEGEKRKEWGIATVIMNKRGNPCPKCLPFVGKVMMDDVWSGGSKEDSKYPLMSHAIQRGLYHPRCRDSHTTYFPGISTADDTWTEKELKAIGENNQQEAKQQYAARQAKKFGRLAKYSLDTENRTKYKEQEKIWLEESTKGRIKETVMNRSILESADYKSRIDKLPESKEIRSSIWKEMMAAVQHRSGTKFEDLIFIDSLTGKIRKSTQFNLISAVKPTKSMEKMLKSTERNRIVAIHNHPNSSVPSLGDIMVAKIRGYKYGLIACHDGKIFKYAVTGEINKVTTETALARIDNLMYNKNNIQDFDGKMQDALGLLKNQGIEMELI